MKTITTLAALLLTTAVAAQPPRGETYRAGGTEPFWSLTIDRDLMRYQPVGGRPVTVRTPRVITGFAGEMYRTPQLGVNVVHQRCSDGMSDRTWRDTVSVTTSRGTVRGCGGGTIGGQTGATLAGTRWTVASVNGRPIQTYVPLTVNFTADRIQGRLCNSFGGKYQQTGERLRIDDVIATQMACRGPAMQAETGLFAMWRGPVRAVIAGNTLTLTGTTGRATLRRAR